ncbi:serine protease inhibitor swm-1-like [Bufo gargarizans]|uniref:serine protease inhibitor swm-1-like n=1 Tax=Bufo gargarizans TaxID=30331 RepID=UPI001CF334EC|nr:serine protease inhibitor swm-1-like [Bufo gargarizans]
MARTSVVLTSSLSLLILISAQGSDVNDKLCTGGRVYDCRLPCPPTCDNPNPTCDLAECRPGCFCPFGTVESGNGKCVKIEECCKGNTTNGCSNDCNNVCEKKPDQICLMYCKIGCSCKPGYLRLPESDQCVLPQDCPKAG